MWISVQKILSRLEIPAIWQPQLDGDPTTWAMDSFIGIMGQ